MTSEFSRKVFPYLKSEYFQEPACQALFGVISDYAKRYQSFPSREAMAIELGRKEGLSQDAFDGAKSLVERMQVDEKTELQWIVDAAEKFCRERAIYNAIRTSISILDDRTGKLSKGAIPKLLQDALGVSFDAALGHDYILDWKERFDSYKAVENRIPFRLKSFNEMTEGGLKRKTLNVALAPTGVGKSALMCSFAADHLEMGYNVVYFTLELDELEVGKRIDANRLDFEMNRLKDLDESFYGPHFEGILNRKGKLVVKEYPTTQAGVPHFRHFLSELKLKKNFTPDVIYVDYANICASSRLVQGKSYEIVKLIAEELRGLAVETETAMISATQTNRGGFQNSDFDMDDTSDSFGLPMTVDLFFGIIATDELTSLNQVMIKQLKSRYTDMHKMRKFVIGMDRPKMRFYDLEDPRAGLMNDDPAVFDKTLMAQILEIDRIAAGANIFNLA